MSEGLGHTGGWGPNRGRSQSGGKGQMYEDLDASESSDWPILSNSGIGSGSRDPSSSSKQSKRANANEKNPGYPPRDSTGFVRSIAIKYYAYRSMDMLERDFLDNDIDKYVELWKDLCHKFMRSFYESEKYINNQDFWDHVKWLDNIIITNTTNVVKGTFEVLY
jgi:hypothetical protein